jgi:hypothetical protein
MFALGTLTPFVVFYVGAAIDFSRHPADQSARFAFFSMWPMMLIPFLACLALAAVVSTLPKLKHVILSYIFGLGLTLAAYVAIELGAVA